MKLARTTLRLKVDLKKKAEKYALEEETTLQEIFNLSLEEYLKKKAQKRATRIVFKMHDLGEPLDNLTRDDFYEIPKINR